MNNANIVSLAAVAGGFRTFGEMHEGEQKTVKLVLELHDASILIGCEVPCGALVFSRDSGARYGAAGNVDAHALITALEDARLSNITSNISVAVSVADNRVHNPLPEDVLEALLEFGEVDVLLVGIDKSVVLAKVKATAAA